ncbi:uncharacterized protein LOC127845634 isoform X2 [Dreissena polymorpha]|uniref:Uncharacterized protein n=1 Tax=Dreissena polymorpha TaxID=45954 RepID=A0A9D4E5H7_DREPO|nr:uncharacterized protein LOC127845634 isoform X2 [Dreissena polymorpha]KAH3772810.1 hypothetical protein DPMN_174157 [Dreissena polymorpha]
MVSIVNKHLQKYLQLLVKAQGTLTECEARSAAAVNSLKNLIDQYQCCRQVNPTQLPPGHRDWDDVKTRLLFKLTDMINQELETLRTSVESLGVLSSCLSQQYGVCMYQYSQCHDQVTDVTRATATLPSLADLLGMCEASERLVRERFLCKQHLITSLDPAQPDSADYFSRHWASRDAQLLDTLREYLLICEEFMEVPET